MVNYAVETEMGTTFLGRDCCVYVRNKTGKYVKRDVSSLMPGEEILWEEEFVKKTLDEVEPLLMTTSRYKTAKNVLHEVNSKGEYIPNLRTQLLRGFTSGEADVKRILLEEDDFSEDDYKFMVDVLHDIMVQRQGELGLKPLNRMTIYNHLRGMTVAPDDSRVYKIYAEVNPVFRSLYMSANPDGEATDLYSMYMAFRTGVMSILAERKPSDDNEGKTKKWSTGKYKISSETAVVLDAMKEAIKKGIHPVKVKAVKKLVKAERKEAQEKARAYRKLTRGVYHKQEAPSDFPCESLECFGLQDILGDGLKDGIDQYNLSTLPGSISSFCEEHGFPREQVKRFISAEFRKALTKYSDILHEAEAEVKKQTLMKKRIERNERISDSYFAQLERRGRRDNRKSPDAKITISPDIIKRGVNIVQDIAKKTGTSADFRDSFLEELSSLTTQRQLEEKLEKKEREAANSKKKGDDKYELLVKRTEKARSDLESIFKIIDSA